VLQDWRELTFLHWRYPPATVQALLPPAVTVETYRGDAWVGLVPFRMDRVRPLRLPVLPWLSAFPETNVRTYVRGPDGRTGIWFFSLDAARLPAVVAGRVGFGLPYFHATMSVHSERGAIAYHSRRTWPGRAGARLDAQVELGEPVEEGPLERFLTARYRLYSMVAGRLVAVDAVHEPWPLRRASLGYLRQSLVEAAGLPAPGHEPVMYASSGVHVSIGGMRPVRFTATARPGGGGRS
jgi:uncharacterized protein YqjF (DUF2071 family)